MTPFVLHHRLSVSDTCLETTAQYNKQLSSKGRFYFLGLPTQSFEALLAVYLPAGVYGVLCCNAGSP